MQTEAEDFRAGKEPERHWIDYWVMYLFFERKGLKMRKPNQEDKAKATAIIRVEKSKENARISLSEAKENSQKKNPLRIDNATLSIIGKEYFIKLAKRNFAFNETNDLSEL